MGIKIPRPRYGPQGEPLHERYTCLACSTPAQRWWHSARLRIRALARGGGTDAR